MLSLVASWLDAMPVSKASVEKKVAAFDVSGVSGVVAESSMTKENPKTASWEAAQEIIYEQIKESVSQHYDPKMVRILTGTALLFKS